MERRIVIIGAGIVGAALAARLGARDGCGVTVLDQAPDGELRGSTGHAPGFVGTLGDAPVLTELARRSVRAYRGLRWNGQNGFDTVGGLEVARSTAAAARLTRRAAAAADAGLPARLVDGAEAAALAPRWVAAADVEGALHFPLDGTARAGVITAALRARASSAGARFVPRARVTAIEVRGGRAVAVRAGDRTFPADDVVVASGVWGPAVAGLAGVGLPVVPVAHPYVYGAPHAAARPPSPFVRWPEHHVYGRDHGDRDGLGTYDHVPLPVPPSQLTDSAELPWPGALFDDAVAAAMALLPERHRWRPAGRLNGVFSMTPDNLPLLGPHREVSGLWSAVAIWVTHAAGAAEALAAAMFDGPAAAGIGALDPDRFAGTAPDEVERRALALYRDIYSTS